MNTFRKLPMKGRVYKIKSNPLSSKYSSFLPQWSKFMLSKSIENTTRNIKQIHLTRYILDRLDIENTTRNIKQIHLTRYILDRLDKLQEKTNTLMQEYSSSKTTMDELYKIRKNYGIYMGKEMER